MALLFILLLWSRFCHLLIVSRFLSLGWGFCLVFKPFKPRPVFGFCMCPFFFVSGLFRRRRVFSCLLFLSGAGETQTPFGGFGVPLVFSSCRTRSPSTTRTSRSAPTPRPRPAPAFFFFLPFRRRRSFPVRCLLVLVLSVSVFLVGVFSASGLCFSLCAALKDRPRYL